jgi:hypothetical protein
MALTVRSNMKLTPEKTIQDMVRENFPKPFIDFAKGDSSMEEKIFDYSKPYFFYLIADKNEDAHPFRNKIIPIWEGNNDYIIAYIPGNEPLVIKYYFEDSKNEYEIIGNSLGDAVIYLISTGYMSTFEDIDFDDPEHRSVMTPERKILYQYLESFDLPNTDEVWRKSIERAVFETIG